MLHVPSKRQESVTLAMGSVNTKVLKSQHRCCGNVSNSETVRNLSDTSKRSNGAKRENNALSVVISEDETQCDGTRADVLQSGENAACFVAFGSRMVPEMVCSEGLHICCKMAIILIVSCKGEFAQCRTDSDVLCRLRNTGCWCPRVGCLGEKVTGDWRKLHNEELHDLQC
jgi:hypothetical protein